ncbi:MAG: hypothetical protein VKO44_01795 [Cyanobacteriota bacterium]|nr:hypothetical protein [Cyanobacteriota bacterium]
MGENDDSSLERIGSEAEKMISELEEKGLHYFHQPQPTATTNASEAIKSAGQTAIRTTIRSQHRQVSSKRSKLLVAACSAAFLGITLVASMSEQEQQRLVEQMWSANHLRGFSSQTWPALSREAMRRIQQFWPYQTIELPGISLPITNRLCNRSGNFCIHRLANLIASERGQASYSLEQSVNGKEVRIVGTIELATTTAKPLQRRRFQFRDDRARTTPGWAALGTFALGQANDQSGILASFRTTESFGPQSPVGVINTELVFPAR